jgi:hypothetical protein
MMRPPVGIEYCQSTLPSAGATLVTPGPFIRTICVTPPSVARCGEL